MQQFLVMFQTCMFCKYATWSRKYSQFTFSGQVSDLILHRSRGPTRTKQTQFAIREKRLIYPNLPQKKNKPTKNMCIVGKVFTARYWFLELSATAGYLRHLIEVLGCCLRSFLYQRRIKKAHIHTVVMSNYTVIFFCGAETQRGSWPPHSRGFLDHTQRRTTVGRIPPDE